MDIASEIRKDPENGARLLLSEYKAGLTTLARRLCADESDAEELVNRTFAEVVRSIDSYLEQSAFFGWMCQILVNIRSKDLRRKSSRVEVADAGAVDAASDEDSAARLFRDVDAGLVRDAVQALPGDMREAVVLRYFTDLPLRRIAKILCVPEGTVNSRLHYARLALAAKLGAAARKPGAKMVLLALLLAAGIALGRGVYTLAAAALSSHAESAEIASHAESAEVVSHAENAEGVEFESHAEFAENAESANAAEGGFEPLNPSTIQTSSIMKPTSLLAATASLALVAAPAAAEPAPVRSAARPRTVAFSVVGYAGSTTLTNFPVLVRIVPDSTNRFDYADCAADGSDIRFKDAAGNMVPHEIDTWDPDGESAFWVALPALSKGTELSMLYGANAPAETASGSVWDGAGYKSVWHMNFSGSTTRDSVASYTGSIRDPHATLARSGEGIVGEAYHCESNGGVHDVRTSAVAGFTQGADGKATFSAWFRQIGGTKQYGKPDPENYPNINWGSQYGNCGVIINSKNGVDNGSSGVEIDLSGYSDNLNRLVVRDSTTSRLDLDTESLYDKRWHHVAVTWDGTTRMLYLDGVLQTVAGATASATYGTPTGTIRLGSRDERNTDCVWTGDLDEIRFLPSAASADWIAAEHAQVASSRFLRVVNRSGTVIVVK